MSTRTEPPPTPQPLYHPIFLAAATRNSKIIALAVSSLQRLIAAGAVPRVSENPLGNCQRVQGPGSSFASYYRDWSSKS